MDTEQTPTHRDTGTTDDPVVRSTLNFKVTPDFKKEFKGFAVSEGITMIELLKEGFELSKMRRCSSNHRLPRPHVTAASR